MSHFSRIKTTLRDRELLTATLEELGYEVNEGGSVKGRQGIRQVDLSVRTRNGNGIGFVRDTDGSYTLVADWYGIGRKDQKILERVKTTLSRVQSRYAEKIVLEKTEEQGFSLVERNVEPDGTIRIVVRRWN
jgi:hypothetical protein